MDVKKIMGLVVGAAVLLTPGAGFCGGNEVMTNERTVNGEPIRIEFVTPSEGEIIAGDLYTLRARLSPSTPEAAAEVARVFFWADFRPYIGNEKAGGISSAFGYQNGVYHGTWDTTRFSDGKHTLGVWIYDKRNKVIAADEIPVVIRNGEPGQDGVDLFAVPNLWGEKDAPDKN